MAIRLADLRRRLASNAEVFRHLLEHVSEDQARWKPRPEKWSLLEVINHLADEERDDFRTRLSLTLEGTGEAWPSIDPPRWAIEREYNKRDLDASLTEFLRERRHTLRWLDELGEVDPEASYQHPTVGRIAAGDLMTAWLAHDLIHIRQMTRLHYEFLAERAAPYSPAYAGDW